MVQILTSTSLAAVDYRIHLQNTKRFHKDMRNQVRDTLLRLKVVSGSLFSTFFTGVVGNHHVYVINTKNWTETNQASKNTRELLWPRTQRSAECHLLHSSYSIKKYRDVKSYLNRPPMRIVFWDRNLTGSVPSILGMVQRNTDKVVTSLRANAFVASSFIFSYGILHSFSFCFL